MLLELPEGFCFICLGKRRETNDVCEHNRRESPLPLGQPVSHRAWLTINPLWESNPTQGLFGDSTRLSGDANLGERPRAADTPSAKRNSVRAIP